MGPFYPEGAPPAPAPRPLSSISRAWSSACQARRRTAVAVPWSAPRSRSEHLWSGGQNRVEGGPAGTEDPDPAPSEVPVGQRAFVPRSPSVRCSVHGAVGATPPRPVEGDGGHAGRTLLQVGRRRRRCQRADTSHRWWMGSWIMYVPSVATLNVDPSGRRPVRSHCAPTTASNLSPSLSLIHISEP